MMLTLEVFSSGMHCKSRFTYLLTRVSCIFSSHVVMQVDIHLCQSEMPVMIDNITYLHCLTDM